jgi:hypothetical protein
MNIGRGGGANPSGGRPNVDENRKQDKSGVTCRSCWQDGHFQNECKNPPLCYFYHNTSHMSTQCSEAEAKKQGVVMYRFGQPRQGFIIFKF